MSLFRMATRKWPAWAVGGSIGMVFGLSLAPQTLGLDWYRSILTGYKDGIPEAVDPDLELLADRVSHSMKLSDEKKKYLTYFTCVGNEPVHKGDLNMRTGAIVGFPGTFRYKYLSEVDKDKLRVGDQQKEIDWDTASGKQLLEATVLSEQAKAFAIARELQYAKTFHLYTDAALKTTFAALAIGAYGFSEIMLQLKQRMKPLARAGFFGFLGCTSYILYMLVADGYYCIRDNAVDRRAAALGKAYAEGGMEFYNKMLSRNQAIRHMLGPRGPKLYTAFGNDVATWRVPHVQLSTRRDNMRKALAKYEAKRK